MDFVLTDVRYCVVQFALASESPQWIWEYFDSLKNATVGSMQVRLVFHSLSIGSRLTVKKRNR